MGSLIAPRIAGAALAALAIVTPAVPLASQSHNTALVGAGLSIPAGVFGAYANPGWTVVAGFERQLGDRPQAIRIDAGFSRNTDTNSVGFSESTRLITLMASVVHHFRGAQPRIYALAGAGLFARRFTSADPDEPAISESRLGIQFGEGITFRIKSVQLFLEGRFVTSTGDQPIRFFPLTVGVRWGGPSQ